MLNRPDPVLDDISPSTVVENQEVILQQGTCFMDIWRHLKQSVKRIEHVEVFPDSLEAWICVSKRINFNRAINSFRAPIYVKATDKSTVVTTLDTNGDSPITIRNPEEMSSYASNVMRLAINHCKSSEPAVADRRPEIHYRHLNRPLFTFFTRHLPPPPPPTSHTVSLSGFHPNTTLRQIQLLVRDVSSNHELNDPNFQVVDGTTIVTSDKTDARRLRRALNGLRLRGVPITATRGHRPYEFGTYPPPNFNPYIYPNPAPYPWSYPYLGPQNSGQNWGQGFGHNYGHNYTQTYTQNHTQNYSQNHAQNSTQNCGGQSLGRNYGQNCSQNYGPGWSQN
ncbi:hypothetical protein CIB48_g8026 [Xylaria polymorpha]|nr:hypothetical protein CIB48_g8026 [Xylaria polymorpha]